MTQTSDRNDLYGRVKRIVIHPDLLLEVFKTGVTITQKCVQGLPDGALLIVCYLDDDSCVNFVFRHSDFPYVAAGDEIPILALRYKTVK